MEPSEAVFKELMVTFTLLKFWLAPVAYVEERFVVTVALDGVTIWYSAPS
jgi:hypothetical protein